MIRVVALASSLFVGTVFWSSSAWSQMPFDPAYGAGMMPYGAIGPLGYGGVGPYGYGGFGGYGGYGYGRFGYGYGMRGYYPPNPFGNLNMLPPNPPSPYYVVPSAAEYRYDTMRGDQNRIDNLIIQHSLQQQQPPLPMPVEIP